MKPFQGVQLFRQCVGEHHGSRHAWLRHARDDCRCHVRDVGRCHVRDVGRCHARDDLRPRDHHAHDVHDLYGFFHSVRVRVLLRIHEGRRRGDALRPLQRVRFAHGVDAHHFNVHFHERYGILLPFVACDLRGLRCALRFRVIRPRYHLSGSSL